MSAVREPKNILVFEQAYVSRRTAQVLPIDPVSMTPPSKGPGRKNMGMMGPAGVINAAVILQNQTEKKNIENGLIPIYKVKVSYQMQGTLAACHGWPVLKRWILSITY